MGGLKNYNHVADDNQTEQQDDDLHSSTSSLG
jgi:hypothetical protein